ncbi:hypothetical protein LDY34_17965, partial [Acinetobacter baumannii]
ANNAAITPACKVVPNTAIFIVHLILIFYKILFPLQEENILLCSYIHSFLQIVKQSYKIL